VKLTDLAIKHAAAREKDYKLFDGGGLFLLIQRNGRKYWRLKYRDPADKSREKLLALGVWPDVSLKEARAAAADARKLRGAGVDPSEQRRQEKQARKLNAENTFEAIGRDWIEKERGLWTDDHAARVESSLIDDVFPYLGNRPLAEITPPEVLDIVRRVEERGALDVASRILQRCKSVFRYAVQTGRAVHNPAAELTGVLTSRKVQHRASLPPGELPDFLKKLRVYDGYPLTRYALRLLLLTFLRPGELRGARWSEFDIERAEWRVPGERMKMGTEHIVPLSRQALELLESLRPVVGRSELLFPNVRDRRRPISENTMTYALYRMGYESRATPHGFRATASSILNERGFNRDAIERQLAHLERNNVRAAYTHHAEYLGDRRKMMQWWADYLDSLETGSNVVPFPMAS
jgi:integrase